MIQTFHTWLERRRRRRDRARRAYEAFAATVAREGRGLEALAANALRPLDATGITRTADGRICRMTVEVRDRKDGAVYVCVDAHGPGRWRKQPGYHFTKHADGSVTYDGAP